MTWPAPDPPGSATRSAAEATTADADEDEQGAWESNQW